MTKTTRKNAISIRRFTPVSARRARKEELHTRKDSDHTTDIGDLILAQQTEVAPSYVDDIDSWELVRAAQSGDAVAFAEIYRRYYQKVYKYISRRSANASLVEDLTSETFLRALKNINKITYRGQALDAWLVTIARNIVVDNKRAESRRADYQRYELGQAEIVQHSNTVSGPEHETICRLTNRELMRQIAALPPMQRDCIVFRYLYEFSVCETAVLMRRNPGAIRALQYRAIRSLGAADFELVDAC